MALKISNAWGYMLFRYFDISTLHFFMSIVGHFKSLPKLRSLKVVFQSQNSTQASEKNDGIQYG